MGYFPEKYILKAGNFSDIIYSRDFPLVSGTSLAMNTSKSLFTGKHQKCSCNYIVFPNLELEQEIKGISEESTCTYRGR